ncbi:methyltransferase domain-containing protein [Rhodobacteraceae bacterium XHP0102]|nr:methyltransferase domain-containing protein [Rhodobacteraceae bacterium XHP0102]
MHARARARLDRAGFLHDEVKHELQERLRDINREFTAPALITPFAQYWADFLPEALRVAPADHLNLTQGAHDLVIHVMALHWADDPVGQIVQSARALKPDGLFLAAFFGGESLSELRDVLRQTEIALLGGLSPRVVPMGDLRDLGGLLGRAGLALPVADSLRKTISYRDIFHLIQDLRDMGETNALADRHRAPLPRQFFTHAGQIYKNTYPFQENRIQSTVEIVFLSGWKPDASQQKPLRPGSAQARLADALGVTEFDETAQPVENDTQKGGRS